LFRQEAKMRISLQILKVIFVFTELAHLRLRNAADQLSDARIANVSLSLVTSARDERQLSH